MATTPHADPPKHSNDKGKAKTEAPEAKPHAEAHADQAKHDEAPQAKAAAAPAQHETALPSEEAWNLFYNGHRIAKVGDSPENWITMGRLGDSTAVLQTPVTDAVTTKIKEGQFYLAEGGETGGGAPSGPPTVVDVPHVSASGSAADCTMGNWTGEPTSYAYAWQRDGAPISGATTSSYTMGSSDMGKQVGCIVTATNSAGSTAAPLSNTVTGP